MAALNAVIATNGENKSLLVELLARIKQQELHIMAKLKDVQDSIAAVKALIVKEKAEVAAKLQALRDQIAAGTVASEADLDALIADVNSMGSGIDAISDDAPVVTQQP